MQIYNTGGLSVPDLDSDEDEADMELIHLTVHAVGIGDSKIIALLFDTDV